MSTLLVPSIPSNLRMTRSMHQAVREGRRVAVVDSDLYNICERIKKLSPRLRVVVEEGHEKPFLVFEESADGVERFVKRYTHLDARIIDDLKYMLHVPLEHRIKVAEKQEAEANERLRQPDPEKLERFTHEMNREMRRANIFDPVWTKNYPLVPSKHRRMAG